MKKSSFAVVAMAFALVFSGAVARAEMKIGTVDMQRALQTVEAGKKAKSKLEREFKTRQKELQTEENAIKKMSEEFKKQSLVMSDEARARKQAEIQQRIMKFQQLTAKSQAEIAQKEHDLTQPIIEKLRAVIADISKQHGYNMILEKNESTVLYSEEKDDLTNEVISRFNKHAKASDRDMFGHPQMERSATLDRAGQQG